MTHPYSALNSFTYWLQIWVIQSLVILFGKKEYKSILVILLLGSQKGQCRLFPEKENSTLIYYQSHPVSKADNLLPVLLPM